MLRRLVPLVGVNAVPLGGVFLAGWSPATARTLYWRENLIGATLVAAASPGCSARSWCSRPWPTSAVCWRTWE